MFEKEKIFYPRCKLDPEKGLYVCTPVVDDGKGKYKVTKEPIIFKLHDTGQLEIIDTGGASEDVIKLLKKHFEEIG